MDAQKQKRSGKRPAKESTEAKAERLFNEAEDFYLGTDKVFMNREKAAELYRQSAELGYPPAMENVATCYEKGTGVQANERLALEWKIRSRAARGDRNAQAWLWQNMEKK